MKIGINSIIGVTTVATVMSCSSAKKEYASFELYPVRTGSLTEMEYTPEATKFNLWSPTAEEVRLMLYDEGEGGHAYETVKMELGEDGTWATVVNKNLLNKFYTFNVKINDKWQGDTPGINAHAVGVNGKRAAIIDWKATNPEGWENDQRPPLKSPADMVIYEMHHRDFSVDSTSGIKNKGKFLALTEHGTMNSDKLLTGIDHLIELGVTHVHLLPSYDYASVDETKLDENQYNWGYDPLNYNVPDGSYSTDPYQPASRDERIYELILDEIRGMAILPFGLPEPQSETLRRLCQQVREAPGEAWSSGQAAKACSMSERTLNRHFQQQTSLTWSEWVRRAKLMEALVRLAQGHSVLRVALELGYGSHSAFSAMFRRVMGVAPSDYFRPPA